MFAKVVLIGVAVIVVLLIAGVKFVAFLADRWHPWSGNPIDTDKK